jgi:fluoride ion exporter CrcB/FEX
MGGLAEYFAFRSGFFHEIRLFLTTGVLGGFTIFRPIRSTRSSALSTRGSSAE